MGQWKAGSNLQCCKEADSRNSKVPLARLSLPQQKTLGIFNPP